MATIATLASNVREVLSLDSSYNSTIEALVRRCMRRLLRDYHFPKALVMTEYTALEVGDQAHVLPEGFKQEYMVIFYDPNAAENAPEYSSPLLRREGFIKPARDGRACYYWKQGNFLYTDVTISADSAGITLRVYHENMDPDDNESWFVNDFEDVLFSLCMYRGAMEHRKEELAKVWASAWAEDRQSLAIFSTELEFDNSEFMMNASDSEIFSQRYPSTVLSV